MDKELIKKIKKNHKDYSLAEFLLALRKAHGYSHCFVGDIVGRTGQSILTLEHKGHIPRLDALIALAKLYGVSPVLLFGKILKDYERWN